MWLHMGILEVFRPGILKWSRMSPLKTFSSIETTPELVCVASVDQLKALIDDHSLSTCSLLWLPALKYLANSMLLSPKRRASSSKFSSVSMSMVD
jgi:hypothetical protein